MLVKQIKKYGILILIAFLAGLTLFSVTRYITLQKENYYLYTNLQQIKKQIDLLESERQKLLQTIEKQNQENSAIKDSLKVNEEKLGRVEADLLEARKAVDELNTLASSLKSENADLKTQLSQASQEKAALAAKLNSIDELKKAIRQIKMNLRQVKTQALKKNETSIAGKGNYGFIIKNGKSTYPAKVIIEVKPLP